VASKGQSVLPVVVQHAESKEVLILAYANRQALEYSLKNKVASFWSTSRNELWIKGATSGDVLELVEVRVNCEQNSLLYLVRPKTGSVCHTKDSHGVARSSCYYRRLGADGSLEFLPGAE
jgi:phosphoribosyl-AMP cyclohydrolase